MAIERTYIMLKPDCLQRGLIGEVISRIERRGYQIIEAKTMMLDEPILREHYAHITDKPFFPETVRYMTSGPVLAMIVEGESAVEGMRLLMGPTKFGEVRPAQDPARRARLGREGHRRDAAGRAPVHRHAPRRAAHVRLHHRPHRPGRGGRPGLDGGAGVLAHVVLLRA